MNKKIKSILLLACRSPFLDDAKIYPPMGILYLDAAIKKDLPDVHVEIDDDYDLNDNNLKKFEPFDAIGVSIMTPQREEAHKILIAVKSKWPEKIMIAGGPHVLHYIDDIEKKPWDYLVRGDGERDIIKILKGEADKRILYDIQMREELSQIPKPDRIRRKKFLYKYHYELKLGVKSTVLITGRGCPMGCKFCEDAYTKTRWHDTELVDQELEEIKKLGYGAVYIPDDLFAINHKKIEPYLKSIKEKGFIFRCNGHAKFMNDKFAKILAEHNCYEMAFGAESGSQKILDNINKRTTVQQNYDFVKYAKKYGILVKAFLMIGLPGEDYNTIADTEKFIKESGIDDFQLSVYYPYKGTQIRDSLDKGGDIDLTFSGKEGLGAHTQKEGESESVLRTSALTSEDLLRERERIIKMYKPQSHITAWKDKFRDTHLDSNVEYN